MMSVRVSLLLPAALITPIGLLAQATLSVKLDANGIVVEVVPGGSGEKAGLKIGDTITGLNNQALTTGPAEIKIILSKTRQAARFPLRSGAPDIR